MEALIEYIPEDRRHALALGVPIADRSQGTALFADISGFTPLADTLACELGPRRGAEELTHHLNSVFDSLIGALHLYGGSVIGFSGDAITCWLDGDQGLGAIAAGLAMQERISEFASVKMPSGKTLPLAMKVAIAYGPVRRFLVGDPERQLIDVLAGRTLDHLAEAEHLAGKGEIILHPSVLPTTLDRISVAEWREDDETGQRFCVVDQLLAPVQSSPRQDPNFEKIPEEATRPWLLPPVYQRLKAGLGEFLAELRPAVAVFVRFSGIDYETDTQAGEKLDSFIRAVERILSEFEGSLIQLTIGDKGSYLYAAFGAPIAHEDDALRAVSAARSILGLMDLHEEITDIQIGISQGRMRTGSYGGAQRRTYGVLGDEVNLAARLMQAAKPGQILGSQEICKTTAEDFLWENLPRVKLKGIQAPTAIFQLAETTKPAGFQPLEPEYTLPMVGRETELVEIEEDLNSVARGIGRIVVVTGEAGVGKSRFVSEAIQLATEKRFTIYGGACQSFGTRSNYLVWQSITRGLFDLHPRWTAEKQLRAIKTELEKYDPALLPRLPLLSRVVGFSIPDNDLTRSLDAKVRKASLEALLVEMLKSKAREKPVLLVLEDCHWIDEVSRDLLVEVQKATANLPVMVLLAYRPFETDQQAKPLLSEKATTRRFELKELTPTQSERLIALKLDALYGGGLKALPGFVESIITRSEGNPFYLEELLSYLREQGIDPQQVSELESLDLPTTLQSLILSRVDRLEEKQKTTLKVASVIGRVFRAFWLWGYYQELGDPRQIQGDLALLHQLDLLSLQSTSPELIYLFKHIMTQQVTYESLPFATRANLHNQLGQFIESEYQPALGPYLDLLAFHYEHSENEPKKREYLIKAGEASQGQYANEAALRYFERALPLLSAGEQIPVMKRMGQVLELVGRWAEAEEKYQQSIDQAQLEDDRPAMADCQTAMGELQRKQGGYAEASHWLEQAQSIYQDLADDNGMGQVLHYQGTVAAHQGKYQDAHELYSRSLELRKRLQDQPQIASLLSNLGIIARFQGETQPARELNEQALSIRRALGDKWAIGVSLNNLGNLAIDEGDFEEARLLQEEGLAIRRAVGDRWAIANALNNLGNLAREQADFDQAASLYVESMEIIKDLEDHRAISYLLEDMGCLDVLRGHPDRGLRLVGTASTLRERIGAPLSPAEKEKLESVLERAHSDLEPEKQETASEEGRGMSIDQAIDYVLQTWN